jgi:hypothetical protein
LLSFTFLLPSILRRFGPCHGISLRRQNRLPHAGEHRTRWGR